MEQLTSSNPVDRLISEQEERLTLEQTSGPIVALIPAYNEARFIGSLVITVREYVDYVVVVDDGSSDDTQAIAVKASATVLRHSENQGKALAINTGINYVRQLNPRAVVLLDGDGQHCADDIPAVLAPVLEGLADIVVGSRFLEVKSDIPAYRQVGQHGLTIATNVASGVRVGDSQSGFRALSPRALEHLTFSKSGFSIESEMQFLSREHNLTIAEVAIKVIYAEPPKRSPVAHGMQVLHGILQLVGQRRLLFFGVIGQLIFLLGIGLGFHILDLYAQTRVLAIGYGLLTVVLCTVGVVLLFAGVMLHSTRGMLLDLRTVLIHCMKRYGGDIAPTAVLIPAESQALEEGVAIEVGK
jgi:glycosyltransferase involved in cell wall biosynthesis